MSNRSALRRVLPIVAFITFTAAVLGVSPAIASGDTFSGTGTVNSIASDERKVNITHGPIHALGWPGMTMDFQLAETASLEGVEPGAKITFELHKRSDGAYEIESLSLVTE
ncbi:MAG: copper-binding protein [Myxococcota bacterium]